MPLPDVTGRAYGPAAVSIDASAVASFVAATGDEAARWQEHAPPSIAGAVLFGVAPLFLSDGDVAGAARTLIHTEQVFRWLRPLAVGEVLEVSGRVTGVRARRSLNLVGFEMSASGPTGGAIRRDRLLQSLWIEGPRFVGRDLYQMLLTDAGDTNGLVDRGVRLGRCVHAQLRLTDHS